MAREVDISDKAIPLTTSLTENQDVDDPTALRARIRELESQLARAEDSQRSTGFETITVSSSSNSLPAGLSLTEADFNYTPPVQRPLPPALRWIRRRLFGLWVILTFGGTICFLIVSYFAMQPHNARVMFLPCNEHWQDLVKYLSIPLVSILFTWWHVWLGIQMCFYPVEFRGCCGVLGWQGIVPRRAHIMARRSCDIMIGTLITFEEIIDRIHPDDFFTNLQDVVSGTITVVLGRLATKHWPGVWERLPDYVKNELHRKVLEEAKKMFQPVVKDIKDNINEIVDMKQMAIDVLVQNKPLLVELFRGMCTRELVFIQHFAAVMGFILGVVQMFVWRAMNSDETQAVCQTEAYKSDFQCWSAFIILPVSGTIIGYFTNWIGINMIFRPVEPHIICGGYINVQGVFLKRQQQVSQELSTLICKNLVHARKILEYMIIRQEVVEKVLEIYQRHMNEAINEVMGSAQKVLPVFLGQGAVENIKSDVVQEVIQELPNHSQQIEQEMDRAFGLRDTLAHRLSRLHPRRFEGMLHPVFKEDEWIVLLLGGVLGLTVGLLQACALGS